MAACDGVSRDGLSWICCHSSGGTVRLDVADATSCCFDPFQHCRRSSRHTDGEFLNQLSVAHGSVRELETHTMIAGRLEFMAPSTVETILERAAEVGMSVRQSELTNSAKEEPRTAYAYCIPPTAYFS